MKLVEIRTEWSQNQDKGFNSCEAGDGPLSAGPLVVILLALSLLCPGGATGAPLDLKTAPAKLGLSATDPTVVVIIASNTSKTDAIQRLRLTAVGESDVTVEPEMPRLLRPSESLSYRVSVPAWSVPSPPSELALLAKFTFKGTEQAAATSIARTAPAPLEVEKLATVEVKASLATLHSDQTEPVYLLIHNKSTLPLKVARIVSNSPVFITFSDLPRNVEVDAGRTRVLRLEAKAGPRVHPGEHQLVFRLPVEIAGERFDLTASQAAEVGVSGESELLGALGITSLLLLPGILVGATASLLWRLRWLRPSWEAGEFPVTPKDVGPWFLLASSRSASRCSGHGSL